MLWMVTTMVSIVWAESRVPGPTSDRTAPANTPAHVLGHTEFRNALLGMCQRLAVRPDLHFGALGPGEDVRLVGHDRALLGERLDLADLARARRLCQAGSGRCGERVERHLFFDLQHGAVGSDTHIPGVPVHRQRYLVAELTVLGLARIASHGGACALRVGGLPHGGWQVGPLQFLILCGRLGRDCERQQQRCYRPFPEAHADNLAGGVRPRRNLASVPYTWLTRAVAYGTTAGASRAYIYRDVPFDPSPRTVCSRTHALFPRSCWPLWRGPSRVRRRRSRYKSTRLVATAAPTTSRPSRGPAGCSCPAART